tara:strand:+ start:904 stop:1533 length:630 start_codon:yes stop_codon:yes gene_type:complete
MDHTLENNSDNVGSVKTYRFKILNDELYQQMIYFSEKHRFLHKDDLKEEYEKWIESSQIASMIRCEEEFLKTNNYDLTKTNIEKKIFKSIKYYHIKKLNSNKSQHVTSSEKKAKTKGDQVSINIKFSKELLEEVKIILQEHDELKPSEYYDIFILENEELINREKTKFEASYQNDEYDCDEDREENTIFEKRLKKMIKNQYYMMFQKNK